MPELVKGVLYHIKSKKGMDVAWEMVGRFEGIEPYRADLGNKYKFLKLAENPSITTALDYIYVIHQISLDEYTYEPIEVSDLPLYASWGRKWPAFEEVLKDA